MAESDASPPFLLATTTTIPSTHASSPNSLHPPTNVPPIPGQEKKGGGGEGDHQSSQTAPWSITRPPVLHL